MRNTPAPRRDRALPPAPRRAAHRRVPTSPTPLQPRSPVFPASLLALSTLAAPCAAAPHCHSSAVEGEHASVGTTPPPPPIKATRAALHRHAELAEPPAPSPFFLLASTSTSYVLRQEQPVHRSP
ncbi:hypothetical protein C2845_PM01G23410 [Panicum miliaceum]|uniref:Uncharacterized protein n=1 Tax=Panicum miliaceum TaxID=4540 RepID=A0A3L6TJG8_PANMI|nr:hypothetical protein C2845_PM01G23410 [Panicum miliaceum]